ncbi:MAG TPA: transglycosylase SLT domain-containing protein [Polyangiaceae bacterium]
MSKRGFQFDPGRILLFFVVLSATVGILVSKLIAWAWPAFKLWLHGITASLVITSISLPLLSTSNAHAAERVVIPQASALYRHRVERAASDVWGVDANPARLAAQLHQESAWRPSVRSKVGAQGMAQFMPATAAWLAQRFPDLAEFDPFDADQAILAATIYDHDIYGRMVPLGKVPLSQCARWNFTLRSYNGGEGWLQRDRVLTRTRGADPDDWRAVERYRTRGAAAHAENIGYPRRILLTLEPAYIAAGWPGEIACG